MAPSNCAWAPYPAGLPRSPRLGSPLRPPTPASGPDDSDSRQPTTAAVSSTPGLRPSRLGLTPAHDCGCFFYAGPPAQPTRTHASPRLRLLISTPGLRPSRLGLTPAHNGGCFFDSGPPAQPTRTHASPQRRLFSSTPGLRPSRLGLTPAHNGGCFFYSGPPA